jgi:hypothetical protein
MFLKCVPPLSGRFIALMMEAVHISETSVYLYETTWRYIPEAYHLHTHHREKLKSHILHPLAFNPSYLSMNLA